MDIAQRGAAETYRSSNIKQAPARKHDIRRVNGDVTPAPIAMPTSALVSAGASFIPSPTMAVLPLAHSSRTTASLPSGRTPAMTRSTPT